ncbi:MAG TPA: HAMP domain-containing sensor histidine kinase [Actinomycetota bacterium]
MSTLRGRVFWTIATAVIVSTALTVLVAALIVRGVVRDRTLTGLREQAVAAQRVLDRPALGPGLARGLSGFFREQQEFLGAPGAGAPGSAIRDAILREAAGRTSGEVGVGRSRLFFVTGTTTRGPFVLARRAGLGVDDWRPFLGWLVLAGAVGAIVAGVGSYLLARRVVGPVREVAAASADVAAGRLSTRVPVRSGDELGELASSFNSMADQLAASRDSERTFLLSVSHELKTPLTAIRGYAEALREDAVQPAEAAAVIGTEAERLERLVRDLLDLGRLDRREFSVARVRVDLGRVARDAVERHTPAAERFGVRLTVDAVPDATALGDHDRLLQVVSNLVENALRATPAGGAVSVRARPATLSVTDTGPGLGPDDVPRAFERFYLHTKYGGDRPVGSGLGLAIVRQLVRAMGGSVEVHSTLGHGTTFVVALPAVPEGLPGPASARGTPGRPDAGLESWFDAPADPEAPADSGPGRAAD